MNDQGNKFDDEKVRVDLLPPDALWEIARVLTFGAQKYDSWNWYKGISYSRLFGAALRHLWQWWRGYDTDAESGLSHLAHVGCCVLFLLQQVIERRGDKDDRVKWFDKPDDLGVSVDGKYSKDVLTVYADAGMPTDTVVFMSEGGC